MDAFRVMMNDSLRLGCAAGLVSALVLLVLAFERWAGGLDRDLAQQLTIHHFERSSWFALNAGKYEGRDAELARQFWDSAAWHANRAREFQRMTAGDVASEAERDGERDRWEGRLMQRALTLKPAIDSTSELAAGTTSRPIEPRLAGGGGPSSL